MKAIATNDAPAAIGPYAQAVVAHGLVYCSGQIPLDPVSMQIVPGGIEAETERVMQNLGAVLRAAGSGFDKVLKTTIYLTDLGNFQVVNAVYGKYFEGTKPARATVQVAALPRNAQVEIDAVAIVQGP